MFLSRLIFLRALALALIATAATSEAAQILPRGAGFRVTASAVRPEVILHAFNCCNGDGDGTSPQGDLIRDSSGALYGTDPGGDGYPRAGTVFKLIPPAAGKTNWSEEILHTFLVTTSTDGYSPVAGLVGDEHGNVYGTTTAGGNVAGGSGGYGTVFELTPPPAGKTSWKLEVLHRFTYAEGSDPVATLARDPKSGILYGTTAGGGSGAGCNGGCGVLFEVSPPKAGETTWTERTLHSFTAADGANPKGSLNLMGGVLYGTTSGGGPKGFGTVFALTPPAAGKADWPETILHAFASGSDGATPVAGLIADAFGDLYGTTSYGGTTKGGCDLGGCGTVFKLTPPAAGKSSWTKTSLYLFGLVNDGIGARPVAALSFDSAGTLYGTTVYGGTNNYGTVFALTPHAGKSDWTATLLRTFTAVNGDGGFPTAGVIANDAGDLYGTASVGGGRNGAGVVYELLK